jgi:hypothetical protein
VRAGRQREDRALLDRERERVGQRRRVADDGHHVEGVVVGPVRLGVALHQIARVRRTAERANRVVPDPSHRASSSSTTSAADALPPAR